MRSVKTVKARTTRLGTATVAILGAVGTALALGAGPAAASTANPTAHTTAIAATGCQFPTGETSNIAVGYHNHLYPTGTVWTKPSATATTCHDLNLFHAPSGHYRGWWFMNGAWSACGDTKDFTSGGSWVVLCSNVPAGTPMAVQSFGAQTGVTIMD